MGKERQVNSQWHVPQSNKAYKHCITRINIMMLQPEDGESPSYTRPLQLFQSGNLVKICAPMVRYSKLPFRLLVRKYGCDLTFTPMIISDSFVRSIKARDSEFTTNPADRPLIVQFAAHTIKDFADAAEIVKPYSDGIDLNCGCPQRWAIQEGYGCALLKKPEFVAETIKHTKERVRDPEFTVSIKIRIDKDLRKTISLCQQVEKAGVSWITVHGRTPDERATPVHYDALKTIKDSLTIPVIANGDIRSLSDVDMVHSLTGVDGVMAARGMLANPAMYAGYETTPTECIKDWIDLSLSHGTSFTIFHHHLIDMLDHSLPRSEKRIFNSLSSTTAVLDFLSSKYDL